MFGTVLIYFLLSTAPVVTNDIETEQTSDYQSAINRIKSDKISLLQNNTSLDSCKRYLLHHYEHTIFPYWVGRPWTYEGHTNTPYQGEIACGYFVSTTLKHMGFNWNRYELAKMYSQKIVTTICDSSRVYYSKNKLINYLKTADDNLYVLGLSNHVGLILKHNGKLWFIHSNYVNGKGPDKEPPSESAAIDYSNVFWIGGFLTQKNIQKWLKSSPYHIVRKKSGN